MVNAAEKLLPQALRTKLIENHTVNLASRMLDGSVTDFQPVVKLFVCVGGAATWLLTELDPKTNVFFGLCDLGHGFPEIGYVSQVDFDTLHGRLERDLYFNATHDLSWYAQEARNHRYIAA